jgi:beta-glucosidase
MKLKFPEGFLWGAATAAHQIEGNNTYSDWWAWEHSIKREHYLKEQGKNPADFYSGFACDSYNRFDEDFSLAQQLHHNVTRLSIEWARLEPKEGEFNEREFEHYEKVLQSAKFHGMETFVTLHHFTLPLWFAQKGGFEEKKNIEYFVRFCEKATHRLDQYADFWITINEAGMYANLTSARGIFPPQKKNLFSFFKTLKNLMEAHNQASKQIKRQSKKPVGMAYNLADFQAEGFFSRPITWLYDYFSNFYIVEKTLAQSDFIGLNYYLHHHIGIFGRRRKHSHSGHDNTDIEWGIHPDGLERLLLRLRKYNKPIYITENGLADHKDSKREKFIKDHLYHMHQALQHGCDVRGYLHWSLLDNFEWAEGFEPRFGLVEIDRDHGLERKIRPSAVAYGEICKNNYMEF